MKIHYSLLLAGLSWLACLPHVVSAEELEVSDAWLSPAPPVARSQAAYMTLTNTSGVTVQLVDVEAEGYAMAMLHRSWLDGDVARMEHINTIELEPGSAVSLAPGGIHIMLMNPERILDAGESARIDLVFADGSRQSLDVFVREIPTGSGLHRDRHQEAGDDHSHHSQQGITSHDHH